MNCPVCGREIVDLQATVCPYCIAPLSTPPPMPAPPTDNVFGGFEQPETTSVFGGQPQPPVGDQPPEVNPFGPPPEEPSRVKKVGRAGMGIGLRVGIVVVLLAAGGFTQVYRSITGAGDFRTIEDVLVGECFNLFDEAEDDEIVEIGSADVLPCAEEHDYELIAKADFIGVDQYSDSLFDTGWDNCLVLAEGYLDFETIPDELSLDVLIPTSASFQDGDRGYLCYVFLDGLTPMTTSWRK